MCVESLIACVLILSCMGNALKLHVNKVLIMSYYVLIMSYNVLIFNNAFLVSC